MIKYENKLIQNPKLVHFTAGACGHVRKILGMRMKL
jgi:hypothetical protein